MQNMYPAVAVKSRSSAETEPQFQLVPFPFFCFDGSENVLLLLLLCNQVNVDNNQTQGTITSPRVPPNPD